MKNEDRRRISVLFIDMAGFTSFSEAADPEQIHIVQREYFATVRDVIHQYGGILEKYIGDAAMAIFGAPIATEDDALRAVRAGLEAQRVLSRGRLGQLATFRVGIATGEALVDLSAVHDGGQAMASGDVVSTASRLQTVAPEGGVLVDDVTAAASRHEIEYVEQPPLTLRGRSSVRQLYLATAARLHRRDRDESTPMVNREHERGLLITALRRTIEDNRPQLITIFGPAGIGKSRLLRELARYAQSLVGTGVKWRIGHCPPFGENVTYAALAEIVKAELGILDSDDTATTRSRLDTSLQQMTSPQEAARLADALGPLVGLPTIGLNPEAHEQLWRRFLVAMGAMGPTVLVFEDMHWADQKMLRLVEMLGSIGPGVPLLIIATARPELRERRPDWTSAITEAVSMSLGPMPDHHILSLCELMVGQAVFQEESSRPLVELAGGNPLYAHEFVRMLVEKGELRPINHQWTLSDPDRSQMPQTVQAVISNRLDLLEPTDRAVLQAAAVVGMHFWPPAVAAALGAKLDLVLHSLQRLQQRDLVAEQPVSSMANHVEYAFRHVLVRDVCYQRLPRAQRVTHHHQTGDWLDRLADAGTNDLAEVIANHRWAAHEIARTIGLDTVPYAPTARAALYRAARRAYSLGAVEAAITAVDRALNLKLPDDPRLELLAAELALLRDSDAFLSTSGMDKLLSLASQLIDTGEASGAARAFTLLGTAAWTHADRATALSYLGQAVDRYDSLPESPEQAEALHELARVHMVNFEVAPAISAAEAAAGIADRLNLVEVSANARITSSVCRFLAGEPTAVAELEAVTQTCINQQLISVRRAMENLAWAYMEEGDVGRNEQLIAQSRGLNTATSLLRTPYSDAQAAFFAGDWSAQINEITKTMRLPSADWDPTSVITSAWLQVLRDEKPNDDTVLSMLDTARQTGFHRPLRSAVAHAALYRALQGKQVAAEELLSELDDDYRQAVSLPFGEWVAAAGHAAYLAGGQAQQRVRAMFDVVPRLTPWVRAAIATVNGEHGEAADLYRQIGDLSDRALSLAWAARAGQLDKGEINELRQFARRNAAKLLRV
ncbi:MAG TPA: AAA family ATPase [Candidatus Limnocylindrales bacterium]|nr:AAA family ATPase [Candidatus Limnocylindrales bacterium]